MTRVFEIKGLWSPPGYLKRSAMSAAINHKSIAPLKH
jgi:hypothetical protein